MKAKLLAALLAVFLLLTATACAASAPESGSAPPPLEGVSDPEPEAVDVSHFYVEETADGIEDREAVKEFYWYLWENLGPREYGYLEIGGSIGGGKPPLDYIVLFAPDKAPIDALLQSYDGPWVPIKFYQDDVTFYDVARAESELEDFLRVHRDIQVVSLGTSEARVFLDVEEITDELADFVENYPVKDVYHVMEFVEGRPD